jgi:hypothetical protein
MANREHMQQWVDALRSGKYTQGRSALRNRDDEYCCLGVACDVSGTGKWRPTGEIYDAEGKATDWYYTYGPDDDSRLRGTSAALLPEDVMDWLGVGMDNPILARKHATDWNDVMSASFDTIADLIEEEYLHGRKGGVQ